MLRQQTSSLASLMIVAKPPGTLSVNVSGPQLDTLSDVSPIARGQHDAHFSSVLELNWDLFGYPPGWDGNNLALFLLAKCENGTDPDRNVFMSGLYINRFYANVNGQLVPVSDGLGQFYDTCDDCYLDHPGQFVGWMYCTCMDSGKVKVPAEVNLGECIF